MVLDMLVPTVGCSDDDHNTEQPVQATFLLMTCNVTLSWS